MTTSNGVEIFKQPCRIYLVRHGESEANSEGIMAGHFDSPLTKKGEDQAKQRGEELKHVNFDAVFSSDLIRAKRTAEIIIADRKLAVSTAKIIRERFFGDWEGRPIKEVLEENKHMLELLQTLSEEQKRNFKHTYWYESSNDINIRMQTFLREIAVTYLGKTVLVVAHGSIIRAFLVNLGFAQTGELPPESMENTSYAIIESDGIDFFIKETVGIHKVEIK